MDTQSQFSPESNLPFSMDDFAKALEKHDYQFSKGQVVRGKVFQHDSNGALVDIGGKSPGFVPINEIDLEEVLDISAFLPLGEEMEFLIIREQDAEGQVLLSRRQLQLQQAWDELTQLQESGKSVQMRVTGTNKGGVIGQVNGLRAFIPRSHLIDKNSLESLVGELLSATLLEVDPDNRKLVLSQREAARAQLLSKLEEWQLMTGKVASIKPYGVFVDLEGVTGLLHINEVSGNRVDSLTTLFQVGQEIKVVIKQIDEWRNRISLSTKVLEAYSGELLDKFAEVMATAQTRAERAKEQHLEAEAQGAKS